MAISADARPFRPCLLSPEPSTSAHNALCDLVPVLSCLSWECCALFPLPRPSVTPHPGPCGWTHFPRGQGTVRSHPSLSLKPQSQTPPGLLQETMTHFWGGGQPLGEAAPSSLTVSPAAQLPSCGPSGAPTAREAWGLGGPTAAGPGHQALVHSHEPLLQPRRTGPGGPLQAGSGSTYCP